MDFRASRSTYPLSLYRSIRDLAQIEPLLNQALLRAHGATQEIVRSNDAFRIDMGRRRISELLTLNVASEVKKLGNLHDDIETREELTDGGRDCYVALYYRSFFLTIASISSPQEFVRPALYRSILRRKARTIESQPYLFPPELMPPGPEDRQYLILVYCARFGRIHGAVGWPDSYVDAWAHYRTITDTVASPVTPEESVPDLANPSFEANPDAMNDNSDRGEDDEEDGDDDA